MDTLSTQQILEKLGLKSSETLRRWRAAGLIDAPAVVPHPDGRGRIAKWPVAILDQGMHVREKLKAGHSLEEIAATVKKRKYRFRDDSEARERNLKLFRLREAATKSLRKFARNWLEVLDHQIISDDQFQEALKLAGEGLKPILVVTESGTMVMQDSGLRDSITRQPNSGILAVIQINYLLPDQSTDSPTAKKSKTGR